MITQENRDTIIKRLDENKNVQLADLFLFDLSPYYDEKKNDSFFYKQLEYQRDRDALKHNKEISFCLEQKQIYAKICDENNKRVILSAPTSFGKTMLVKEFIYNKRPNKVVVIVPTNSLADELIDDFVEIYKDYTIYDTVKENSQIKDNSIFVGTQEKFYQIYKNQNDLKIDLFVIDEAHKLTGSSDGARDVFLDRIFIDLVEKSEKTILLLPLVNQIEGLENWNFETIRTDYSPVAKNCQAIPNKGFDRMIMQKITENKEINLIYFNTPDKAEKFYLDKTFEKKNLSEELKKWIQRAEKDFHKDWIPIKSLESGIGIHTGGIPKFIQKKVVDLFKKGEIKTILGTSSIIEGVNTPTKNIFLYISADAKGKALDVFINNNNQIIKFKNLIGRAGRLGEHKVGNIYYIDEHRAKFENAINNEINLTFRLEEEIAVEINRENEYNNSNSTENLTDTDNNNFETSHPETIKTFSKLNLNIPAEDISKLLDQYGFSVKKLEAIVNYVKDKNIKKENITVFGIIGKFNSVTGLDAINIIIDKEYKTIDEILKQIKKERILQNKSDSQLVSIIIKMIYNEIPHRIIPVFNFMLDLEDIYKKHNNGKNFLLDKIIDEMKDKKLNFLQKFIGTDKEEGLEIKVMSKLFEYGIPCTKSKTYISTITQNIPEQFSINDIKKMIKEKQNMKDLEIYFE